MAEHPGDVFGHLFLNGSRRVERPVVQRLKSGKRGNHWNR
jgi:hypothetical protein